MTRFTPKRLLVSVLILAMPAFVAANEVKPGPMPVPAMPGSGSVPVPHFAPNSSVPTFGVPSVQNPRLGVNFKGAWGEFSFYFPQLTTTVRAQWNKLAVPRSPHDVRGRSVAITFTMTSDGAIDKATSHVAGDGTSEEKALCQRVLLASSPFQPWTAPMIAKLGKAQELTVVFSY